MCGPQVRFCESWGAETPPGYSTGGGRWHGMNEPRSGEDGKRVGSPATQRNVVRVEAGSVTE